VQHITSVCNYVSEVLNLACAGQELVGFLSETADMSADEGGGFELAEDDLDEVYTVIVPGLDTPPPERHQQQGYQHRQDYHVQGFQLLEFQQHESQQHHQQPQAQPQQLEGSQQSECQPREQLLEQLQQAGQLEPHLQSRWQAESDAQQPQPAGEAWQRPPESLQLPDDLRQLGRDVQPAAPLADAPAATAGGA